MSSFFNSHAAEIFGLINLIFGIVLLPMLSKWLNEHLTKSQAARAETAIHSGLQAAIASATEGKGSIDTLTSVLNNVDVRNNVVAMASEYVRETVPGTIGKLGIDPQLEKVISARVDDAVASLAAKYTITNKAIQTAAETEQRTPGSV